MNSIKDLLASVKCCISNDIYQKDKAIRFGSIKTDMMYSAIINRIIYSIMSDTQYFDTDNIIGTYEIVSYEINGIVSTLDYDIFIFIDTDTVKILPDLTNGFPDQPWSYNKINDNFIIISDFQGQIGNFVLNGNNLTVSNANESLVINAKKIESCFDESDICEMYQFLNKQCKPC